ncbi:MAG: hypothetical protein IPK31_16655 [Chitinophagaceae bacterium]|nr:hypothetical protein [Chitinophagaceae bacterium]
MYSYELMETGCHYLIQEKENEALKLIKVHFKSDYALCISTYNEGEEIVEEKEHPIHDIAECLDDKVIASWGETVLRAGCLLEDEEE